MPPRGWIGGWRQRDWLRTAMTSFSTTFVTIFVLAAPSHFRITFTLNTYDLIVEIPYQLLGLCFWRDWTMFTAIVVPVDVTISCYDTRLQLFIVHSRLITTIGLKRLKLRVLIRHIHARDDIGNAIKLKNLTVRNVRLLTIL